MSTVEIATPSTTAQCNAGDVLFKKVVEAFAAAGKDITKNVTVDDLAKIDDAFHSRGRQGTAELLALAEIKPSDRVLDVGCGIGGTARQVALTKGSSVSGVDLNPAFIQVGDKLNEMVDLDGKISLCQGSATDMSAFEDDSFDVAYTEHVQMFVQDKVKFYGEISSKLKPGGKFLFHDIFRGGNPEPPTYPAPWADSAEGDMLAPVGDIRRAIELAGLQIVEWRDVTEATAKAALASKARKAGEPEPLSHQFLMGQGAKEKMVSFNACLQDGRTAVVMGMAVKAVI